MNVSLKLGGMDPHPIKKSTCVSENDESESYSPCDESSLLQALLRRFIGPIAFLVDDDDDLALSRLPCGTLTISGMSSSVVRRLASTRNMLKVRVGFRDAPSVSTSKFGVAGDDVSSWCRPPSLSASMQKFRLTSFDLVLAQATVKEVILIFLRRSVARSKELKGLK